MNFVSCLGLAAALLTPGTPGGDPARRAPPVSALPASSYACVQFAGLQACRSAADEMGLLKLVEHFAAKTHAGLDQHIARAAAELDEHLRQVGLDRATVRRTLQGRMALGLGRPTFFGDDIMPSVALVIDVQGRREAASQVLATVQGFLMSWGPDMVRESVEFAGSEIQIVRPREHNGAVASAFAGSFLVISNSPGYLKDCLRTLRGDAPSLAEDPNLKRAAGKLEGSGLLSAYVNTRPLLGWLGDFLPYEVDAVTQALGLHGLNGLYFGLDAGSFGSREVCQIGIANEEDGLVQKFLGRPVSHRAARMCPPDTLIYATASIDGRALVEGCEQLLAALPAEARRELQREFGRELDRELRHTNLDTDAIVEIVSAFGPEVTIALPMSSMRQLPPTLLAFVDVRGQEGVEGMLAGMLEQTGAAVKSANFRDHRIHYVSVQENGVRLSPSFVVHDGMLVVASDLRGLKAALAREGDSLASQPGFESMVSSTRGASMLFNLRIEENLKTIWDMIEPRLEGVLASHPEGGISIDDLPTSEQLAGALRDVVVAVNLDREGISVKSDQPVGLGSFVAVIGKYVDLVLSTDASAARRKKIY